MMPLQSRLVFRAGVCCLAACGAGPAVPSTPRGDEVLIQQLAAAKPGDRIVAEKMLVGEGEPAIPCLTRALADPRPEVASRALAALRRIRLLNRHDIDGAPVEIARRYLASDDPAVRLDLLGRLEQMNPSPQGVIAGLYLLETSQELRGQLASKMNSGIRQAIPQLIVEGDEAAAAEILEGWAEADPADAAADFAMFKLVAAKLDAAIDQYRAQYSSLGDPNLPGSILLTELYRAAGRRNEAKVFAARSSNDWLMLATLIDRGDWTNFNALPWAEGLPDQGALESCGANRLRGRLLLRQLDAPLVAKSFTIPSNNRDLQICLAHTLMLNDDPLEGIDLVIQTDGLNEKTVPLLAARGDYDHAFKVAENSMAGVSSAGTEIPRGQAELDRLLGEHPAGPASARPTAIKPTPFDRAMLDFRCRRYAAATSEFDDLARQTPGRAICLYMEGRAMVRNGDAEAGNRLMIGSKLIPLADPELRTHFARDLEAAGFPTEAGEQAELATRTVTFINGTGRGLLAVYRFQAERAAADHHWGLAAERYDRAVLVRQICAGDGITDSVETDYLTVPALAHLMHARDWWDRGDTQRSLAELDRYQLYFPLAPAPVIEFVNKLDAAGDRVEADRRFTAAWRRLSDMRAKFPDSPKLNAAAAALSAGCGRRDDLK